MQAKTLTENTNSTHMLDDYKNLVDIKTVRLREGASRAENADFFINQIKNPHKFRVCTDVVEIGFSNKKIALERLIANYLNCKG